MSGRVSTRRAASPTPAANALEAEIKALRVGQRKQLPGGTVVRAQISQRPPMARVWTINTRRHVEYRTAAEATEEAVKVDRHSTA